MSSTTTLFDACSIGGDNDDYHETVFDATTLLCISRHLGHLDQVEQQYQHNANTWFLIFVGSLVFFMQGGFAMVCAGCVRKKNLQNTMMKNIFDASFSSLMYWAIGYAFAFGGQSLSEEDNNSRLQFVGTRGFFGFGDDIDYAFYFMQFAFSATCVTIVAGSVAERLKMAAYIVYTIFLSGLVYPCAAHAVWSGRGFLSATAPEPLGGIGVIDFAGSGVIHVVGGTAALCATYVLGPRVGRFYDSHGRSFKTAKDLPGQSIALQLLGTMILWFGCK